MKILIPLRTVSGMNVPEHFMTKARRVRQERATVGWSLVTVPKPSLPCVCTITRIAPSAGLDTDNLAASAKAVRDAVADWLGVDDRHEHIVEYRYAQERGQWAVVLEFRPMENKNGQIP